MDILPAIDLRGGRCVRLRQGDYAQETVFNDDPVAQAKSFADAGATWLHLVDLDGAKAGRPVNTEAVRAIVQSVEMRCELGGGLRDDESVRVLLEDVGVHRVIIGTAALKNPDWFRKLIQRWGNRVVLGVDARDGFVATAGWLEASKTPAIDLIRQFVADDLRTVIYTNIANDGMMQGIDDATFADMAKLAELGPDIIASGGVTSLKDIERLVTLAADHPNLTGAIVGRALYEHAFTLEEAINVTAPPPPACS